MHRLTEMIRRKDLALATERSYRAWLGRHRDDLKRLTFHLPSEQKLERILTGLEKKDVAASTQNQAYNAIISRWLAPLLPATLWLANFHRPFGPGKPAYM